MDINKECKLFLKDVYLYDITSCHYTILDRLGYDLSSIEKDDKLKRNTQIGLMMKENPRISTTLRTITTSTIDGYLNINNINEDELILRAYDGVIVTKKMTESTDAYIPIDLQDYYEYMLISIDRQRYLAKTYNKLKIKGVSHRYPAMDKMYEKLMNLNFANKVTLFKRLQSLKEEILTSEDVELYCIPMTNGKYSVFLLDYGQTSISGTLKNILDIDDIDRQKYFDLYLKGFFESIVIEFV